MELSNRVHHVVLNIYNIDRLEQESTYRVISKGLKGKSIGHINIYRGRRHNKRTN